MRASGLSSLCLFALFLAACTAGQHVDPGATQAQAPLSEQMHGRAVVLTNANLPPQGANFTSSNRQWQVHGVVDGVPYRYGQADPQHLFVANYRGAAWTDLTAQNSWSVSCVTDGRDVHCVVESPGRGGMFDSSLALVDDFICTFSQLGPDWAPGYVEIGDGRRCSGVADPARVRQDLMAGRTTEGGISGYGFRQALVLRNWLITLTKTGSRK